MLAEIEERLIKILQERVKEIPEGNIVLNGEPTKSPAVTISNRGFEFENLGLAENMDEGRIKLKETFNGDGAQTSYKLKEKPMQGSVQMECPLGTSLTENKDFVVNYNESSIDFRKGPSKGKEKVSVTYLSHRGSVTMKSLKMKAKYSIDVWGTDTVKADFVAEKVVKALLSEEDKLAAEGIEVRPIGGETLLREKGEKTERIRLDYMFEQALRAKKLVPPIEKIEITKKNI